MLEAKRPRSISNSQKAPSSSLLALMHWWGPDKPFNLSTLREFESSVHSQFPSTFSCTRPPSFFHYACRCFSRCVHSPLGRMKQQKQSSLVKRKQPEAFGAGFVDQKKALLVIQWHCQRIFFANLTINAVKRITEDGQSAEISRKNERMMISSSVNHALTSFSWVQAPFQTPQETK